MSRKTAHEIDVEAAEWAARVDTGPLCQERELALQQWLASDPRCLGAFGRMRAIALASERACALGSNFDPSDFALAPSRRRVLLAGSAVAATMLVGVVGGWAVWHNLGRFRTIKGEVKVIALKDGSVVTLNTASEIVVNYSEQQRSVELIRGEALFEVAKNCARPFIVAAGDTSVRVVGTSFTVRRLDNMPVQVLVRKGTVEVFKPTLEDIPPVRISANTRAVTVAESPKVAATPVGDVELRREMAWQDGHIAFEGQTIEQAAAEFARYSDIKIVITDRKLAHEEIAGLYRANDPVGFAKSIAVSLNAHVQVGEGEVRLTR
jgi:transmembrane sensor